jgi:hypothetical protein
MQPDYKKIGILILLLIPCIWLVRRNLFRPTSSSAASSTAPSNNPLSARTQAGGSAGSSKGSGQPQMLDLDPTLRLDLLEASRAVEYRGSSRNIFEFYNPPPPPTPVDPAPPLPPPDLPDDTTPPPPKPPAIALKFYGTAQRPGGPRRAFLTDGEEITIAKEGDVVAKFYRISRIGVSSLELVDTRSMQTQQLPLIEE